MELRKQDHSIWAHFATRGLRSTSSRQLLWLLSDWDAGRMAAGRSLEVGSNCLKPISGNLDS